MGWEKFESRMRIKRASNSNYSTSSHTIKIFFDFLFQSCITFNFSFKASKKVKRKYSIHLPRHAWQIFDHSFYYLRRTCKEMNNWQAKTTKSWQTNQLQPFQPFDKIVKRIHGILPNLVVVTITVYWFTIFAGSSHVSHVCLLYIFSLAL